MHKGRYYPQPKRRWLTPYVTLPYFAPVAIKAHLDIHDFFNPPDVIVDMESDDVLDLFPTLELQWTGAGHSKLGHTVITLRQRIPPSGNEQELRWELASDSVNLYTDWMSAREEGLVWPNMLINAPVLFNADGSVANYPYSALAIEPIRWR